MMMKRWMVGAAALLWLPGCGAVSVPGVTPQKDEPAEAQSSGDSYAGTWTREDNGAEFAVSDDGTTVKGELTGGNEEYQGYFDSYTFELEREGKGLKGKATFVFKDDPDNKVVTQWEVTREGAKLKGKLEYVKYDDDGNEEGRGIDEKVFALAAAAAPAAAAYTPPAVDMSAYVKPLASYKYMLYEDAAVGQWIEVETAAAGQKYVSKWSVVAETDDAWVFEMDNQMNQKDLIIAVFVDKETGRCLKAFVGKRGEKGKEKEVPPEAKAQPVDGPEGEDVDVDVKAGTFAAKLYDASGSKSWMGTEGDTEGVLLKSESAHGKDELVELDADQTYEAGDASFAALYLKYESGREEWRAKDTKPHFNAQLRMKMSGSDTRLVGQGDSGAEPAFDYPR